MKNENDSGTRYIFRGLPKPNSFAKIFAEYIPIISFVIDRNGIFRLSEGAALKLIGMQPGEAVGKHIKDLFPNLLTLPEILKALEEGKRIVTHDKVGDRDFRTVFTPYDIDGEYQGLMGFALDTTKSPNVNLQIKNLFSPELINMYAHDIRGALAGVQSFLKSICEGEFLENLPEEQKNIFSLMTQNCDQVLQLTNKMMKDSSRGQDAFQAHFRSVVVHDFFYDIYEQARPIAESKGLRLILSMEKIPTLFTFDPALLRRAVNNLLYNAFEHSKSGLFIELGVKESIDHELFISIKDEGVGMPQHHFDSSMQREKIGEANSGLGLFIVKRVVDAHHGKFQLKTQPFQGCKFIIRIPRLAPID